MQDFVPELIIVLLNSFQHLLCLDDGVTLIDALLIFLLSNCLFGLHPLFNLINVLIDILLMGVALFIFKVLCGLFPSLYLLLELLLVSKLSLFLD